MTLVVFRFFSVLFLFTLSLKSCIYTYFQACVYFIHKPFSFILESFDTGVVLIFGKKKKDQSFIILKRILINERLLNLRNSCYFL